MEILKMDEDRLRIEDELKSSRLETEKYRLALLKSEECMRKAIVRSVVAFNNEAMTIFNENVENGVVLPACASHHLDARSSSASTTATAANTSLNRHSRDELLARKVRQFCEAKFDSPAAATAPASTTAASTRADPVETKLSASEPAKKHKKQALPNTNAVASSSQISRHSDQFRPIDRTEHLHSNNKTFQELFQHHINNPPVRYLT